MDSKDGHLPQEIYNCAYQRKVSHAYSRIGLSDRLLMWLLSFHWYFAIIYHPEHVLRPASNTKAQPVRASARLSLGGQSSPMSGKVAMVDRSTEDSSSISDPPSLDERSFKPAKASTSRSARRPSPAPSATNMSVSGNSEELEVCEVIRSTQECSLSDEEDELVDEVVVRPIDTAQPASHEVISVDDNGEDGKEEEPVVPETTLIQADDSEMTYIFTFDSLGSQHPQAVRTLKNYLCLEALDKKQVSLDLKSMRIQGKTALVIAVHRSSYRTEAPIHFPRLFRFHFSPIFVIVEYTSYTLWKHSCQIPTSFGTSSLANVRARTRSTAILHGVRVRSMTNGKR
ncbi:hypothetical protein BOTBODRAFT_327558 [Botryobasidium botryosum FD-172 SS1]|uniref:Uncharacterized protein n=1 Tax=Botryobasidium botryosum (strain FD-172 SS1) TaxID=930990 RepID=A0A067NB98_BOTB1|nr:hypothetical protein BOTBODRAFT_327558 [Botryobasidium botryosum FD-172 SS1]